MGIAEEAAAGRAEEAAAEVVVPVERAEEAAAEVVVPVEREAARPALWKPRRPRASEVPRTIPQWTHCSGLQQLQQSPQGLAPGWLQ